MDQVGAQTEKIRDRKPHGRPRHAVVRHGKMQYTYDITTTTSYDITTTTSPPQHHHHCHHHHNHHHHPIVEGEPAGRLVNFSIGNMWSLLLLSETSTKMDLSWTAPYDAFTFTLEFVFRIVPWCVLSFFLSGIRKFCAPAQRSQRVFGDGLRTCLGCRKCWLFGGKPWQRWGASDVDSGRDVFRGF